MAELEAVADTFLSVMRTVPGLRSVRSSLDNPLASVLVFATALDGDTIGNINLVKLGHQLLGSVYDIDITVAARTEQCDS